MPTRRIKAYSRSGMLLTVEQLMAEGWVVEPVKLGANEWLLTAIDTRNPN